MMQLFSTMLCRRTNSLNCINALGSLLIECAIDITVSALNLDTLCLLVAAATIVLLPTSEVFRLMILMICSQRLTSHVWTSYRLSSLTWLVYSRHTIIMAKLMVVLNSMFNQLCTMPPGCKLTHWSNSMHSHFMGLWSDIEVQSAMLPHSQNEYIRNDCNLLW